MNTVLAIGLVGFVIAVMWWGVQFQSRLDKKLQALVEALRAQEMNIYHDDWFPLIARFPPSRSEQIWQTRLVINLNKAQDSLHVQQLTAAGIFRESTISLRDLSIVMPKRPEDFYIGVLIPEVGFISSVYTLPTEPVVVNDRSRRSAEAGSKLAKKFASLGVRTVSK